MGVNECNISKQSYEPHVKQSRHSRQSRFGETSLCATFRLFEHLAIARNYSLHYLHPSPSLHRPSYYQCLTNPFPDKNDSVTSNKYNILFFPNKLLNINFSQADGYFVLPHFKFNLNYANGENEN